MPRMKEDAERRQRIPFGARRDRLQVFFKNPADFAEPNGKWHAVWLNEDAYGTIQEALAKDYQYVTKDEVAGFGSGDVSQSQGGIDNYVHIVDRTGMRIFLMKIDRELYEEDEAMRQAENEAPFLAIKEKRPDENLKQYAGRGHSIGKVQRRS